MHSAAVCVGNCTLLPTWWRHTAFEWRNVNSEPWDEKHVPYCTGTLGHVLCARSVLCVEITRSNTVHCSWEFIFLFLECFSPVALLIVTEWRRLYTILVVSAVIFCNFPSLVRPAVRPSVEWTVLVDSSWNMMAHGDAREGKWRRNWRMEWVASTLHTTSEHGVCSITTADAHNSAANSQLNWRPPPI
jgi:hypothetical protein